MEKNVLELMQNPQRQLNRYYGFIWLLQTNLTKYWFTNVSKKNPTIRNEHQDEYECKIGLAL